MRDVTPTGPTPSRRLVNAGALGAAVAVLTGCGIRLEDDAPRVPLVPARSPIDGEDALIRLLGALRAGALAQVDPLAPISPLLAPLHKRQVTVLHDALRQRGVPEDQLPSATLSPSATSTTAPTAPSASGTQTPASSTAPSVSVVPSTVATVEGSIVTAGAGAPAAEAALRPTLLSVLAQAHAALDLAATAPTGIAESASPSPAPSAAATPTTHATPNDSVTATPRWSQPQSLAPLIRAVRTATYFLQVAAARSPQAVRAAGLAGIAALQTVTAELVEAAGDAAPAPELGFALPHPVETPAEAATLVTQALTTLLSAFGSELPALSGDDAAAAFSKVPQWLGTVAAQAHRHGIPLTPFPGLE